MNFKAPDATGWIMDNNIYKQNLQHLQAIPKRKLVSPQRSQTPIRLPSFRGYLVSKETSGFPMETLSIFGQFISDNLDSSTSESLGDAEHIYYLVDLRNNLVGVACLISDEKMGDIMRKKGWNRVESLGMRPDGIFIFNLCISKSYRGLGLAKNLVSRIISQVSRGVQLRCQVDNNNRSSNSLFKKLGFTEEQKITNSSGQGQTNLVFWVD